MDIFEPKGTKQTAAFSLDAEHLRRIEKIAKSLGRSKSAVVDQLIEWGLARYDEELRKRSKGR